MLDHRKVTAIKHMWLVAFLLMCAGTALHVWEGKTSNNLAFLATACGDIWAGHPGLKAFQNRLLGATLIKALSVSHEPLVCLNRICLLCGLVWLYLSTFKFGALKCTIAILTSTLIWRYGINFLSYPWDGPEMLILLAFTLAAVDWRIKPLMRHLRRRHLQQRVRAFHTACNGNLLRAQQKAKDASFELLTFAHWRGIRLLDPRSSLHFPIHLPDT